MKKNYQIPGQITIFEYLREKSKKENTIINIKTVAQASLPVKDKSFKRSSEMKDYMCHKVSEEEMQPIIDLYDKARESGDKTAQDEYAVAIINKLSRLIKSKITEKVKADLVNYMDYEDIEANAWELILKNLHKYNPRRSTPSSFFTPWVYEAISKYISDGKNMYYVRRKREFDKRLEELGFVDGLNDIRLTDDVAAKLLGEKTSTIRKTKEATFGYKVSLDEITEERSDKTDAISSTETIEINEFHRSPEEMCILKEYENESSEKFSELWSSLTPYEQFIFKMKHTAKPEEPNNDKKRRTEKVEIKLYSLKDISDRLEGDEELLKKLNLKKRPCPATIRQDLINIKIKLAYKVKMYEGYEDYSENNSLEETTISYMKAIKSV